MTNSFKDTFQKERQLEADFGPIMRFSMLRNKDSIAKYIFVEGSTDKTFYEHTKIKELSENAYYFFRTTTDDYDINTYKGKESVFYALKRISENEKLSQSIDQCRFIVDRDYAKIQRSKYLKIRANEYKRLLVTKGHSMESYFLDEHNLKIILDRYGLSLDVFANYLNTFSKLISRYYALKAMITENNSASSTIRFKRKYTDDQLFMFDFSNENFWKSSEFVTEECNRMEKILKDSPYHIRQAYLLQQNILNDDMLIRGHDAFYFLDQYIYQNTGTHLSFPKGDSHVLHSLINSFNVELCSSTQ